MSDDAFETLLVELAGEVRGRFWGKYRGVAQDVDDPERMGRIRARVPSVLGDTPLPWALPCVPFAGDAHGLVLLPARGDGVWIEFEGGDPALPVWTGCRWARGELPAPGKPKVRVLATPGGLQLVLDDDRKELRLVHPDGPAITLKSKEISIEAGSARVVLSSQGVSINDGALKVS